MPLRVALHDAKTGLETPGNVRILRANGEPLALERAEPRLQDPRPLGWHASAGSFALLAPPERLRIEAFQGLETAIASREVDLSAESAAQVDLYLERFVRASERGLAAGNTHLHLMRWERPRGEVYLRAVSAADQLDFVWISHLERAGAKVPYTTNELGRADLDALATPATRFGWGEELRHDFAEGSIGYGHALLLEIPRLIQPVSIGRALTGADPDAPGLARGIAEARAQGGAAIWAHGSRGTEHLPSWVLGRLDALNLFDGAAPSEKLRGDHATFASVYYRLLDVGLAPPFSTGTDWFIGDLARVYVRMTGEHSREAFLRDLRAGRSFITNGPVLELDVDGAGPGGVLELDAPRVVRVKARAIGRANFRALEVVVNGAVAARSESLALGNHFAAGIESGVAVDGPAWIALRVAPGDAQSEFGKPLFAHTSAVVVELAGERRFDSAVARELVLEMDRSARTIRARGSFASERQADEVTAPYREAISVLGGQMGWIDWLRAWAVRIARTLKGWLGGAG